MSTNARFLQAVPYLVVLGVMNTLAPARADTFVIDDQTNTLAIIQTSTSDSLVPGGNTCQGFTEIPGTGCRLLVSRNEGATRAPAIGDQILNLAEPDGVFLSDMSETHKIMGTETHLAEVTFYSQEVTFYSQPEGLPVFRCDALDSCWTNKPARSFA
jgi:hypothetical protein